MEVLILLILVRFNYFSAVSRCPERKAEKMQRLKVGREKEDEGKSAHKQATLTTGVLCVLRGPLTLCRELIISKPSSEPAGPIVRKAYTM